MNEPEKKLLITIWAGGLTDSFLHGCDAVDAANGIQREIDKYIMDNGLRCPLNHLDDDIEICFALAPGYLEKFMRVAGMVKSKMGKTPIKFAQGSHRGTIAAMNPDTILSIILVNSMVLSEDTAQRESENWAVEVGREILSPSDMEREIKTIFVMV